MASMSAAGEMTSKERVLCAFARCEPDRVPVNYIANPGIDARLKTHFALQAEDDEGLQRDNDRKSSRQILTKAVPCTDCDPECCTDKKSEACKDSYRPGESHLLGYCSEDEVRLCCRYEIGSSQSNTRSCETP